MLSSEAFRQSGNRWVLLVALALIPALHAVLMLGRIHPDEVYQVIEPAFARVHGYGILAWEWDLARGGGIRNWAPPFFFAAESLRAAGHRQPARLSYGAGAAPIRAAPRCCGRCSAMRAAESTTTAGRCWAWRWSR